MATTNGDLQSEVKSWLDVILKDEKLQEFSVDIVGTSEQGDGYMGDIVFVCVNGVVNNEPKKYDLVLKCSKRSEAFRTVSQVKDVFLNEIAIYDKIVPYYEKYQIEKGIHDPFKATPTYFGSYLAENMEVIALQNMKSLGYKLWPKKQPLTKRYVEAVLSQYAKFHATSYAIEIQEPERFQTLVASLSDFSNKAFDNMDLHKIFGNPIDESCELLKDELDESVLQKWKGLKNQIDYIMYDIHKSVKGMKAILHGDCWSNNFMYLDEESKALKVIILDWQIARYSSPLCDLSYFLFSCISREDLKHLDDILLTYYAAFQSHLSAFGVEEPHRLWLVDDFFAEWKRYSRHGILMASLLMKIVSTEKDEVLDMAQMFESGKGIGDSFSQNIKDKGNYKKRIRPIVEYAVKHDLI